MQVRELRCSDARARVAGSRLSSWPRPVRHVTLSSVTSAPSSRLAWIDWMRGLACVLMFQTHCYDAWLGGDARNTSFLKGSQLLGTLPAPLFLFLAGASFALVTDKLIRKNLSAANITRAMARRGAEILAFGLLFRFQEFLIAWGWAPWSDLLRVDVLNMIGLSMILMALTCGFTLAVWDPSSDAVSKGSDFSTDIRTYASKPALVSDRLRARLIAIALAVASLIALLTPPLYTTWRPTWLPWWLESYIDGCHNLGAPQSWLFPLFPWSAFAFAGLAVGFILTSDWSAKNTGRTIGMFAAAGIVIFLLSWGLNSLPVHLYPVYDYWHTSPNFFLARFGTILVVIWLGFAWCQ